MNYQHLTVEELVRHICSQGIGGDLELEGELIRRVRAGEVVIASHDALEELRDEITGKDEEISALEAANTAKQERLDQIQTKLDEAVELLA